MLNKMFVICTACQRSIPGDFLAGAVVSDSIEHYFCQRLQCVVAMSEMIIKKKLEIITNNSKTNI